MQVSTLLFSRVGLAYINILNKMFAATQPEKTWSDYVILYNSVRWGE